MADTEQYPRFPDGDTIIACPSGTMSWKLHAAMLRNASEVMRDILDDQSPRKLSRKLRDEGHTILWKLEMVPTEDDRFVLFKPIDLNVKQTARMPLLSNGMSAPTYHRTYDMFFRCLYSMDAGITTTSNDNGGAVVWDCVTLLQVAEKLGAVSTVRAVVENNLLHLDQMLWSHVGSNPEPWAEMAMRLQSPTIFREAMIHIVGAWNLPEGIKKENLQNMSNGGPIIKLALRKSEELMNQKLWVETNLLNFFPQNMMHEDTGARESLAGRSVYANDVYKWQALTILRQYIANKMHNVETYRAPDGGILFYRTIASGAEAYITREYLEEFHTHFAMTAKGRSCLRYALAELSEDLKTVVQELLVSNLQMNVSPDGPGLRYLTCTKITGDDMPW